MQTRFKFLVESLSFLYLTIFHFLWIIRWWGSPRSGIKRVHCLLSVIYMSGMTKIMKLHHCGYLHLYLIGQHRALLNPCVLLWYLCQIQLLYCTSAFGCQAPLTDSGSIERKTKRVAMWPWVQPYLDYEVSSNRIRGFWTALSKTMKINPQSAF